MVRSTRVPLTGPCRAAALALLTAVLVAASPPGATLELELQAASAAHYGRPHDIVLSPDGQRLYVADNERHRIAVLDPMTLVELGELAAGEVSAPHDVVFDAAGRLLVADTGNARIAIYALSGTGGRLVGELTGSIRGPEGVAVHPDGRVIASGAWSGNVVVFENGRQTVEGTGFSSPHDVEVDAAGRIWLADAGNDRVVRLDDRLRVVQELSGAAYGFDGPRYLDFDAQGRMHVADKYTHRIKIIAPDGTLVHVLGAETPGRGPGLFDRPEGVEIRDADVWYSDTYNDRIVRYRMR